LLVANILLLALFGPALAPTTSDDSSNDGEGQEQTIVVDSGNAEGGTGSEDVALNADPELDVPSPLSLPGFATDGPGGPLLTDVGNSDTPPSDLVAFDEGVPGGSGGAGVGGGGGSDPGTDLLRVSGFGPSNFGGPGGGGPGGGGPGGGGDNGGGGETADLSSPPGNDDGRGPAAVPEPATMGLLCVAGLGLATYLRLYRSSRPRPLAVRR
jgi:hypothetical protein